VARGLGAAFEEGLICFEMGRCLDDIAHLESAGSIFEKIDAKTELSRVDVQIALVRKGLHPIDHGTKPSGEFEHGNDNAGNGQGQAK